VWGWASWRRAWRLYDFDLRPAWVLKDTWDTQWQLSLERAGGLSIVPNINVVKNIGFGGEATHTRGLEPGAYVEAAEMPFPLVHPRTARVDEAADIFTYYSHHRLVRHHRLVWLYWLADQVYLRLKAAKRILASVLGRGPRDHGTIHTP
jgi:hypothetical protein